MNDDDSREVVGVGSRIGKYEVLAPIGEGGFGAVFRAKHLETKKQVAIKVLSRDLAKQNREIVQRFQQEAFIGNEIGHENIVETFDFGGTDGGQLYIVMEFLDGISLHDEIKRNGPMAPERAVPIALQIADALGAAHARGIVHRDLKPANVFLVRRAGRADFVKVLDFGVAKYHAPDGQGQALRTATHAVIGSPSFMSPEQC